MGVTGTGENTSPQLVSTDTEWLQMSMSLNISDSAGEVQMFNQTLNVPLFYTSWQTADLNVHMFSSNKISETKLKSGSRIYPLMPSIQPRNFKRHTHLQKSG